MKYLILAITLSGLTLGGCNYNDLKNTGAGSSRLGNGAAGSPSGDANPEASVDFQTVKTAVFEQACIKCHGASVAKEGVRVDEYAFAIQHLSAIRNEVESGDMPPPPPRGAILSPEQKAMLIAWIDSGAPEKTVVTPKPPVATPTPEPAPGTEPSPPVATQPTEPTVPANPPVATNPPGPTEPPAVTEPPVVVAPAPPVPVPGPAPATPDFAMVSQAVFQPHCIKCHSNTVAKGHLNLEDYANAAKHADEIVESLEKDEMPRKAPPLAPDLKAIVYAWVQGGAPETVP